MLSKIASAALIAVGYVSAESSKHGAGRFGTLEGVTYSLPTCQQTPFCNRNLHLNQEFTKKLDQSSNYLPTDFYYSVDPATVVVNEEDSSITARLNLSCNDYTQEISTKLDLTLWFYQNGIMRALLEEPDSGRFRISQEGLPVVDEQLKPWEGLTQNVYLGGDYLRVSNLTHEDGSEQFTYHMNYSRFNIMQYSDDLVTLIINPIDSLYFENGTSTTAAPHMYQNSERCFSDLKQKIESQSNSNVFKDAALGSEGLLDGGVKKAISLGFYMPSKRLFGLPEREDTFMLKNTGSNPYQLFATDQPQHMPNNQQPLYGSVPYVTSLSESHSAAVTWVNSAHTWISIEDMYDGKYINFVSEGGALELFVFSSSKAGNSNRVKKVQEDLAIISGYVPMPPIHVLGFHFCKWANVSAEMLMERNRNFTEHKFPVDMLWADIEWSDQYSEGAYEYFVFNPQNFTSSQIEQLNSELEASYRRITVIVDPHIRVSEDYQVYSNGIQLQDQVQPEGNMTNIFVRTPEFQNYYGWCWPGNVTYMDFLNENAQDYWGTQFKYENFKGSNYLYSFWNDMNEPSVFSTDSHTMPMDMVHWKADGRSFEHRDIHNAYGAFHQRSSWRGLLARDNYERRPFVLTRSFFLGSQKFGAFWTGDNRAIQAEIQGSVNMLLQLSVSGHPFGGADVPGFYGGVTDDLFVQFYQVGAFYPFFRAHTHLDYPNREPWLQSQRVQDVIRAAINQRYDFIHYIYTAFEQMTRTAEPLMRPMWQEFPDQVDVYEINSQFMIGSSVLFAPKVVKPTTLLSSIHMQEINFFLPSGSIWYNYQSKTVETLTGVWQNRVVTDLQQGLFVLGGTTLPLLQHENCMALLACIENAITLEIYIDGNGNSYGQLYLDDGYSLDYTKDSSKSALIKFVYEGNTLSSFFESGSTYVLPDSQQVTRVIFYGIDSAPALVLSGGVEADFIYDSAQKAVITTDFSLKLGQGKMVELTWN